jgi:hypothetical protein
VAGGLWSTRIATRVRVHAPLPDGYAYDNVFKQNMHMRWAKMTKIHTLEDLSTYGWVAATIERTDLLDHDLRVAALDCARASINPAFRNEQGVPFGPEVESPSNASSGRVWALFHGLPGAEHSRPDRTTFSGSPNPLSPRGALRMIGRTRSPGHADLVS